MLFQEYRKTISLRMCRDPLIFMGISQLKLRNFDGISLKSPDYQTNFSVSCYSTAVTGLISQSPSNKESNLKGCLLESKKVIIQKNEATYRASFLDSKEASCFLFSGKNTSMKAILLQRCIWHNEKGVGINPVLTKTKPKLPPTLNILLKTKEAGKARQL